MDYPELHQKLKEFTKAPIQVNVATVTKVDEGAFTCDLKFVSGATLSDVRLKAAIDELPDGVVEVPEVDSSVLVGVINNETNQCFVLKCSKVAKVIGKIESTEFEIDKEGLKFKNEKAEVEILDKVMIKVGSKSVGGVLDTFFQKLGAAQILTPAGPGTFKPDTIADINTAKADLATILK